MMPQKSDRQIAELVGISHNTVKSVRDGLIACGQIDHIANRLDATGKRRQPATKLPKEPKEAAASAGAVKSSTAMAAPNNANLEEIARLARESRSLLTHITPANVDGIYKRIEQIIRLTGFETKSHSKGPETSNAKLDLGAFGRVFGHA
jgi:hypothetical protein